MPAPSTIKPSDSYSGITAQVYALLRSDDLPRRYTLAKIAEDTAIDIGVLKRFSAGIAKKPSAEFIEKLNNYLSQAK